MHAVETQTTNIRELVKTTPGIPATDGAGVEMTNNCPSGIATQKSELRARLNVDESAQRLARFFKASIELMKLMARGCGHDHLNRDDITSWKNYVN